MFESTTIPGHRFSATPAGDQNIRATVENTNLLSSAEHASDYFLLCQLADSAFPSGGFAHSGGLEGACKYGEVRNSKDLADFIEASFAQLRHGALPFVKATFEQHHSFAEFDELCDAFTSNHVANRASRSQGQALLASAEKIFALPPLKLLRASVIEHSLPGHFAPAFGAVACHLQLSLPITMNLFVFLQLRGWISSAVRLGIVGPLEGQAIQFRFADRARTTAEPQKLSLEHIAQTAPLLDLFQGGQDRLYSRLFQS